uniref:Venom S1 protease 22 n=1 Tax=Lethocerus distinctifemur TaxID=280095 RepID=A0A2K8JR65_9HEMI|nr:venom S1 protease 22 [Lethocerus distinctifemur]
MRTWRRGGVALCALFLVAICRCSPYDPAMAAYMRMVEDGVDSKEHGLTAGLKTTNCSCGWTNKARIVGGKETLKNEYPLMVGVMRKTEGKIFCGAALVTTRHVLTAAHCPFEYPDDNLTVALGQHDQLEDVEKSGALLVDVAQSIVHEKFDVETYLFDIALLVLERAVEFTQLIGPACLPSRRMHMINEQVKVLGWGRIQTGGPPSTVLLKTNLKIIPIKTCANNYIRPIEVEDPHQFCTYLRKHDSCQGDSGGPVLWLDPDTNRYTLVAIVSYGKKCGRSSPSLNVDVSYFLDWIQAKIKETDSSVDTCAKV